MKLKSIVLLFLLIPASSFAVDLGSAGTATCNNTTPDMHGYNMFTVGKWWQEFGRDITSDPIDPNSDAIIALANGHNLHVDFAASTCTGGYGNSIYSMPINIVSGNQATSGVSIPYTGGGSTAPGDVVPSSASAPQSDCVGNPATPTIPCVANIPIPTPAPMEEGVFPYTATFPTTTGPYSGGDHHLLIAQRNETTGGIDTLFELYQAYLTSTGWWASTISTWNMNTGIPRKMGYTSGDVAGLPILPLMPKYDEYLNGTMNHALRMPLGGSLVVGGFVWPGRHGMSSSITTGIPFGGRFRIKASWYTANRSSYTGYAGAIVDTLYHYGGINSDNETTGGTGLYLTGLSDDRIDETNLLTLQNIPNTAFEVLLIHPVYSVTKAPACIKLNTPFVFTLSHYPSDDVNYSSAHYLIVDGANYNVAHLDDSHPTTTISWTPTTLGTHILHFDQSGEYSLADSSASQAITVTSTGSCAQYFTLAYSAGAYGTVSGSTPQTVNSGGSGTAVAAVANPGYHFVSWSDGVTTAARTDANVTANTSVAASFAVNSYTLTFSAGRYGSIQGTKTQSVGYGGSTSNVKAVPDQHHQFINWTGTNGFITTTANPLVLNDVKVNQSIKANFK